MSKIKFLKRQYIFIEYNPVKNIHVYNGFEESNTLN